MTLLTYHSKYVVQSSTAVTTTSSSLVDDTQASQTFSLDSTKTLLVIYISSNGNNVTNATSGKQNAINIDGTDYGFIGDSGAASNRAVRNSCIWCGSLASGSHTIKGRFSVPTSGTVTISDRTLLIYIFDGDEYTYISDSTSQSTTSSTFVDDSYASTSVTPSGTCKALVIYSISNDVYQSVSDSAYGFKCCISIGGTDYIDCTVSKSGYNSDYPKSATTAYAAAITSTTTIKGRIASNSNSYQASVYKRYMCILLLSDSTTLDIDSSTSRASTTSTSLIDDPDLSITRNTADELLVLASATKLNGTSAGSYYGFQYGVNVDSTDNAISKSSHRSVSSYANSNFVAYAASCSSGSHTITGRFSSLDGTSQPIDTRNLIALWFSTSSPVTTLDCTSTVSGTGSLSASPSTLEIRPCSASISGTGEATANNILYKLLSSSLSGTGLLTASNILYKLLTSSITASGALTANGIVITYLPISSSLTGSGAESANAIELSQISSSIEGSGLETGNASLQKLITSALSGVGVESSTVIVFNYIDSSVIGSGSESATATVINQGSVACSSTLSGTGLQSATSIVYNYLISSISGTGNENANASLQKLISSVLSGTGLQTSSVLVFDFVTSSASGSGELTANATVINQGSGVECSSFISGTGSQSSTPTLYEFISSSVAGTGLESATIYVLKPISSSVSGSGLETGNASLQKIIQSVLSGTGLQTASVLTYEQLSSILEGSGSASSNPVLYNYVSSNVIGEGQHSARISLQEIISSIVAGVGDSSAEATVIIITHKDFKYPLTIILSRKTRTATVIQNNRTVTIN